MTKAQGKTLFHRHMNHIMGKHKPKYTTPMFGIKVLKDTQFHDTIESPCSKHKIGGGYYNHHINPNITAHKRGKYNRQ